MNVNVYSKHTIPLSIICVIGFLFSLPIILNGAFYIDDLDRLAKGYGWDQDGRPFATLFMKILSFGMPLTDLSPFTNIVAVLLLLLSGYIFCDMLNVKSLALRVALTLPVICSPYLLQGLSYKWDSLTISLSIFLAVVPFLLLKRGLLFPVVSGICLSLSLLTYQASVVIYPIGFILILSGVLTKDVNFSIKEIIARFFASLVLGGVFYKIISWALKTKYDANRGKLFFDSEAPLSVLKENLHTVLSFSEPLLKSPFGYILLISLALILIGFIVNLFVPGNKVFLLSPLLIVSSFVMVILLLLLLKNPPVAPRLFPGLPFALIVTLYWVSKFNSKIAVTLSAVFMTFAFVVCASYFNAFSDQYKSQEQIASEVFSGNFIPNGNLVIEGRAPLSLNASLTLKKYPFLIPVLPVYLNSGWVWGGKFLYNHRYINNGQFIYTPGLAKERDAIIKQKCSASRIIEGRTYTLRIGNGFTIIDFNNEKCH